MKNKLISVFAVATVLSGVLAGTAHAAGASFYLSPASGSYSNGSSFTVDVRENGANVNVVTAKLTYNPAQLTCNGVGASSAFANTIAASCANGSINISRYTANDPATGLPTTVPGDASVGTISFTAISTGATAVNFAAGSQIASAGTNLWDGNTNGGNYTLTAAAPAGGSGGGTTSGSTGSTTGTGSKTTPTKTTTGSTSSSSAPVATGTTGSTPAPTATATDTTKPAVKSASTKVAATTVAPAKNHTTRNIIGGIAILAILGGAAYAVYSKMFATATPVAKKTLAASAAKARSIIQR